MLGNHDRNLSTWSTDGKGVFKTPINNQTTTTCNKSVSIENLSDVLQRTNSQIKNVVINFYLIMC